MEGIIEDAYKAASEKGYKGSQDDFVKLLQSDDNAFNSAFNMVGSGRVSREQFSGELKKKSTPQAPVGKSGSVQTQPTSGSKDAQFDPEEYKRRAIKAGWSNTEEYRKSDHRYKKDVPESELASILSPNKKVIYRGTREEIESQIAVDVKKEVSKSSASESTAPINVAQGKPKSAEEGLGKAKIVKEVEEAKREENRAKGLWSITDIDEMESNPEAFNDRYYKYFVEDAAKYGDALKYSSDLRAKFADQFIDKDLRQEFAIANELDGLREKMYSELNKLRSNPNANTPEFQKLIQQKASEYDQIFKAKENQLNEFRANTNKKYQERINEIDNLFRTGEAVLREDALNAEKRELQRKMSLIELASNKEKLSTIQQDPEYKTIPGADSQEKLLNLLNAKLTAYQTFKNYDRGGFSGKVDSDKLDAFEQKKSKLESEIKDLMYLTSLRRYANPEDRPDFFEAAGESFLKQFAGGVLDYADNPQIHAENLDKISKETGIDFAGADKSYIEYASAPTDPYSGEWWGGMTGTSTAIMTEMLGTKRFSNAFFKNAIDGAKNFKFVSDIASKGLARYNNMSKPSRAITRTLFNSVEEGAHMQMTNELLHGGKDEELTFAAGFLGNVVAAPVNALLKGSGKLLTGKAGKEAVEVGSEAVSAERAAALEALGAERDEVKNLLSEMIKPGATKDAVYMIEGTFGNKAPEAVKIIQKIGEGLIARPVGEVGQEFGEEIASIWRQSDTYQQFVDEFKTRFPDADAATQFVVASYVMGLAFGASNTIGDVFTVRAKNGFDQLSPEQQEIAKKAMDEATKDVKESEDEVISEVEIEQATREKSPEEQEWESAANDLQTTVSDKQSRAEALNNEKKKIYDAYGITDPKTEDISNISESDARKLQVINSKIDKAEKEKIDAEVELDLHNNKRPQPVETGSNPVTPETIFKTKKEKENAVQKPSTEEVLPREQGTATETGGKPQGMGQSIQGQEVTQEGEKVSQEGVNRLNNETFADDVTPEQKAKVEEQNQKDEDEAIDEIYDFNEEIKSIGTKEQFKQFLRSLSPAAAFSRIAWHNTNKPTLEPREGQYYTNTRKNAEDTYKGENTFPAIVFGNAPKKATFDEVQDVNTEAVKGEGADVVVTDDLSPAIGAEMNYREFVPTSADQIIPIGTKENIDAFKAFVEQQKTSEEAKPTAGEKVQPEAKRSGKSISQDIINMEMEDLNKVLDAAIEFANNNNIPQSEYPGISYVKGKINKLKSDPAAYLEELYNFKKDKPFDSQYISNLKQAVDELKGVAKPKETIKEEAKPTEEAKPAEEKEPEPEEQAKMEEEVAKSEAVSPKNVRELIGVYRKVFNLPYHKAFVSAMVSNRLIKQMAKRAGVTTEQMYQRLQFKKASEKDLPKGVKMQVDAWHGSPYEFDRFTTEKMGTGEGVQAFGWGLYFTDLKGIAQAYAKALSGTKFKGVKLDDNPIFEKLLSNLDAGDESFYNYDKGTITNLSNFKKYIDDRYDYLNNLSKNIDENHPLVKRFLSDNEYSQEKLNVAKENLKSVEDKNINIYKMLIDNGVSEKEAKALADSFYESKKKSREFIYEAMKYQASRESLVKKYINFVKNDVKSDLNYFKYLKDNFDKFELSRYLYKVSLQKGRDTDQYTWLEWDRPLSKNTIEKLLDQYNKKDTFNFPTNWEFSSDLSKITDLGIGTEKEIVTGEMLYTFLEKKFSSAKEVSLYLLDAGIDGVKYPAESLSRGRTSDTARGFNYVVFDENAVSIEEVIKFQKDAEKARGAMMIGMDGQAIIYALTDPNISTPLHELAHVFEHYLTDAEKNQIIKAAKTKGWTTETSEYFARGFEKYLAEGKSSDPIFEKFKQFLLDIYKAIKGSPIDVKLNKDMKAIYATMLGEDLTEDLGETLDENIEINEIYNEFTNIQEMTGIDKLDAMREFKEKYGDIGNRIAYIDRNFDNILEKLNAIKTCIIE